MNAFCKRLLQSLFLACPWLLASVLSAAADSRPNVIVILVDDMGWSDIGCYGGEISTPNLDRLAANGLRYSQFYNTGRCSPTRASLLTGHYPHQAGMGHLDGMAIPGSLAFQGKIADTSATLAEVLQSAGYFTAMSGKWHIGQHRGTAPWQRGFMRSLNLKAGGLFFPNQGGKRGAQPLFLNGEEKSRTDPLFGDDWYSTYLFTDWGLKFIDEAIEEEKPFFLYLAHPAPHFPLMAPADDIARYRGKYMAGWDKLRVARRDRQIEMGLIDASWPMSPREDDTPAWDSLPRSEQERYDHMMAIYAAMVDTMDQSVGTLVDGLKQRGQLDNTLILFMSDNGGNAESGIPGRYIGDNPGDPDSNVFIGQCWAGLNNTPFRKYKHHVHEGGSSTPLIAHWPEAIAKRLNGQIDPQPGHLVDVMATLVDICDADYPTQLNGHQIEAMQGVSLKPSFKGKPLARKEPIFFQHEGNRAVRDGKWKLVAFHEKEWKLYNMDTDRTELNDLSERHPEKVSSMSAQFAVWAERTHCEPWPGK